MFADAIRFADILSPVTPEAFFEEYYDTKPLLVPGRREKAAGIMSWDRLNTLLGMTAIWSSATLQLIIDNDILAPARYCRPAIDRSGNQALQPDARQVLSLLRQGASLVKFAEYLDNIAPLSI